MNTKIEFRKSTVVIAALVAVMLLASVYVFADVDNLPVSSIANLAYDETGQFIKVQAVAGGGTVSATPVRLAVSGGGAIDVTTAFAKKWYPGKVSLHATAAVVEAVTIKFVSTTGGSAEVLERTFAAGWTDIVWTPLNPGDLFDTGDELHIECANSGAATITGDVSGIEG